MYIASKLPAGGSQTISFSSEYHGQMMDDGDRHVNRLNDQGEASNNLLKPPFWGMLLGMGASHRCIVAYWK